MQGLNPVALVRVTNSTALQSQQGVPGPLGGGGCHFSLTQVVVREWGPPSLKIFLFLERSQKTRLYVSSLHSTIEVIFFS